MRAFITLIILTAVGFGPNPAFPGQVSKFFECFKGSFLVSRDDPFQSAFTQVNGVDQYQPPTTTEAFYNYVQSMPPTRLETTLKNALFFSRKNYLEYNPVATRIMKEFGELFPGAPQQYKGLLFDFGILDNWDKFTAFLKAVGPDRLKIPPLKLRQMFSESLGDVVLYRGVALPKANFKSSEEAIQYLKTQGNWAKDLRSVARPTRLSMIRGIFIGNAKERWKGLLSARYAWNKDLDTMVSVSKFPEIARNVAYYTSSGAEKNYFILLELKIPQIEVIRMKYGGFFWAGQDHYIAHYHRSLKYFAEGKTFRDPQDQKDVEAFVPVFLNPQWINKTSEVVDYRHPIYSMPTY